MNPPGGEGMDVFIWQLPPSPCFRSISAAACSEHFISSLLQPQHFTEPAALSLKPTSLLPLCCLCQSVRMSVCQSKFCLEPTPVPDSPMALIAYLQTSQFALGLSIWHSPTMSQWSNKPTDVFAFCTAANLWIHSSSFIHVPKTARDTHCQSWSPKQWHQIHAVRPV